MIVISITDCPLALRGDLTKWFQEINTGVYVGHVSARVRDEVWKRIQEHTKSGRATMVFRANNEQRMDFRVHNTHWEPIDFDGLKLMLRPVTNRIGKPEDLAAGFSTAAKMRKAKQMAGKRHGQKPQLDTYAVVDVETTGLSVSEHEIIEIGACIIEEGEIVKQFHALVQIGTRVPQPIQALTGITDDIIAREGQVLHDVMPEFLAFVGNSTVVSHNADFDYGFLRSACRRCGLPLFSNPCVDTLMMARRLIDDLKSYKLSALLEYFGIEADGMHRSMQDCIYTKQLYEKLIEFQQAGG